MTPLLNLNLANAVDNLHSHFVIYHKTGLWALLWRHLQEGFTRGEDLPLPEWVASSGITHIQRCLGKSSMACLPSLLVGECRYLWGCYCCCCFAYVRIQFLWIPAGTEISSDFRIRLGLLRHPFSWIETRSCWLLQHADSCCCTVQFLSVVSHSSKPSLKQDTHSSGLLLWRARAITERTEFWLLYHPVSYGFSTAKGAWCTSLHFGWRFIGKEHDCESPSFLLPGEIVSLVDKGRLQQ